MKTIIYSVVIVLFASYLGVIVKKNDATNDKFIKKNNEVDSLLNFSIKYEKKLDDTLKLLLIKKEAEIKILEKKLKAKK
jgi:hypothetical protein